MTIEDVIEADARSTDRNILELWLHTTIILCRERLDCRGITEGVQMARTGSAKDTRLPLPLNGSDWFRRLYAQKLHEQKLFAC